jgi:hypothetical protein
LISIIYKTVGVFSKDSVNLRSGTSQELNLALVRPKKRRKAITLDSETVKIASRLISAESSAQSQMPDGVKVLEERELLLP